MAMSKLIRILIADDSSIMRRLITQTLNLESCLEVVGAAKDGAEAITYFETQQPDVVLLDMDMPKVNGLAALKAIRELDTIIPVIMLGSFSAGNDAAMRSAIAAGATDCICKPAGTGHLDAVIRYLRKEVVSRILAWGGCSGDQQGRSNIPTNPAFMTDAGASGVPLLNAGPSVVPRPLLTRHPQSRSPVHVLAVGASTGGPNALAELISQLPGNLEVPVLIVQHMPPHFTQLLAERLDCISALSVREGFDGAVVRPGEVWLAPGGLHMTVMRKGTEIILKTNQNAPEHSCRPAIDVLFRSVAEVYGGNALAVVLTGMGRDGTIGCQSLSKCGAQILVQDEASSVIWGMPRSVVEAGLADSVLGMKDMAPAIMVRIRGSSLSSPGVGLQGARSYW